MIVITDYTELDAYVRAFAEGHLKLMLICGPPGVGKSFAVRQAVGDRAAWIDGNATAFGLYCFAYQHLDQSIVLDDVDRFYRDRNGFRLLTALCQSDSGSWVSWETDARRLRTENIPNRYYTASKVCLVTNSWERLGVDVRALEDRGHFVSFVPTPQEVHRRTAEWFWDQEIYDAVGASLGAYVNHSFRTYLRAYEIKSAGLDWNLTLQERRTPGDVPYSVAEHLQVRGQSPEVIKRETQELKTVLSLSAEDLKQALFEHLKGGEL